MEWGELMLKIEGESFKRAVLAEGRSRWNRVVIRPVVIRNQKKWQFSYFDDRKDVSKNYKIQETQDKLKELMSKRFKIKNVEFGTPDLAHDRNKQYVIQIGAIVPFLQELGIQTREGKIVASMYNKFVQINQFLKIIDEMNTTGIKKIVDFGSGNGYLTLATYHYFNEIKKSEVEIIGVDQNKELVNNLQTIVDKLGWERIKFVEAKIENYLDENIDMVIALHNCDTATDDALAVGLRWKSKIILAAPCCQHYLQTQIKTKAPFEAVFREGILKERLGDIMTDALRAAFMRTMGYKTDVFQFIDSKHTPKNVMIRAIKSDSENGRAGEYKGLTDFWGITPYIETIL